MSWLPRPAQRVLVAATGKLSVLWRGRPPLARGDLTNCPDVPLIGFHLFDAIQEGLIRVKGGVAGFTEDGVRFGDGSAEPFQDVILATGFRAAVDMLGAVISLDECGFARRVKRVCSLDQPDLYFVGHNYDARGGLFNIVQDCRLVAREIARRA